MKNLSIIHKVLIGAIVVGIVVLLFVLGSKPSSEESAESLIPGSVATTATDSIGTSKSPSKASSAPAKAVTLKSPKVVLLDLSTEFDSGGGPARVNGVTLYRNAASGATLEAPVKQA